MNYEKKLVEGIVWYSMPGVSDSESVHHFLGYANIHDGLMDIEAKTLFLAITSGAMPPSNDTSLYGRKSLYETFLKIERSGTAWHFPHEYKEGFTVPLSRVSWFQYKSKDDLEDYLKIGQA